MTRIFKEAVKLLTAVVLGLVYMWFLLSFTWSLDDMSVGEKIMGVAYIFLMMPIYSGIKRLLRLS
ncbi:hypothetical protein [Xylanibacter muris]|uniref:Uncharacterized protein n=1 Tax=Xylanibacter muris TaxID=2736290 RepID=A0ABX2AL98_9BACT|nr:hypothetical protein [Xylanibacter muris]NPD91678.1 hypothetical protein [Xylanibacter muris]